ncbi:MAG: hypothetical protein WA160_08465 [Pseudobdellovibrio sp.]
MKSILLTAMLCSLAFSFSAQAGDGHKHKKGEQHNKKEKMCKECNKPEKDCTCDHKNEKDGNEHKEEKKDSK